MTEAEFRRLGVGDKIRDTSDGAIGDVRGREWGRVFVWWGVLHTQVEIADCARYERVSQQTPEVRNEQE